MQPKLFDPISPEPAFLLALVSTTLLGIVRIVSGADYCGSSDEAVTAVAKNCTSKTKEVYGKIVAEIINGNDSGAPQLCSEYSHTEKCLHNLFDPCGGDARTRLYLHLDPLRKTVGRYCSYLEEENGKEDTVIPPTSRMPSGATVHHHSYRSLTSQALCLLFSLWSSDVLAHL